MIAIRALHVVASINQDVGGPAITVPALTRGLVAAGARCSVATLDYVRHGARSSLGSVREVALPAGGLARALRGWSPPFARTVERLAQEDADIVHGHGLWMFPNLYARRAAIKASLPLVTSPRGMLDAWSLGHGAAKKAIAWHAFEKRNLGAAAAFHATSEAEAQAIRALGLRQPVAVIPNGVEIPELAEAPARELLEARFASLRGKRWLLFLSRLNPKKGVAELLSAWRGIQADHADWQLVLAGPDLDGYGQAMQRRSVELGLGARVTFTGMLAGEAKSCALANAELFVLPTHSENFGIAVAEALAHGVPAITTRAAPWAGLRDASCGWWIRDHETDLREALQAAMRRERTELRAMGQRGREMVARQYSWEQAGRQMLAVYLWLAGKASRPSCVTV